MAAEKEVLQDFLVKLGFHVDAPKARDFLAALRLNCLSAVRLAGSLAGVTVAAEAMATMFARSMEKMYYTSQRTRSSVSNLQALDFATRQIGLNADVTAAAIEQLAENLRFKPGTEGMAEMIGISTKGVDRVEVLLDAVGKLKQNFEPMVGASFAERLFGMDARTFGQISDNLEQFRKAYAERKRLQGESGVDADRAARAGRVYMQELRTLWEKVGLLGDRLKIELVGPFREVNKELSEILTKFTHWLSSDEGRSSIQAMTINMRALGRMTALTFQEIGLIKRGEFAKANELDAQAFQYGAYLMGIGEPPDDIKAMIEKAGKGKGNLSVTVPGFTPSGQALRHGVGINEENDTNLLGPLVRGNLFVKTPGYETFQSPPLSGLQMPPAITMNVNSNVTVVGAKDPEATAAAVGRAQQRVLGDAVRNLGGTVR